MQALHNCEVANCKLLNPKNLCYKDYHNHMSRHHKTEWEAIQQEKASFGNFKCSVPPCDKAFTSKRRMEEHASNCSFLTTLELMDDKSM